MVRGGPGSYRLKMNESEIEAEIHTLRDGGLLMQARNFTLTYSEILFDMFDFCFFFFISLCSLFFEPLYC